MKKKANFLLKFIDYSYKFLCIFTITTSLFGCGKLEEAKQIIAEQNRLKVELLQIESQKNLTIDNIKNLDSRLNELIQSKNKAENRYEDLKEEISDFLMNHKLAVASIISGVGGFAAQFADESDLSAEAKGVASIAGFIGGTYALFNWDEIEYVGSKMISFSQKEEQYTSRVAKYKRQIHDVGSDLEDERLYLERINRKISNISLRRNEITKSNKSNPLIDMMITIINAIENNKN